MEAAIPARTTLSYSVLGMLSLRPMSAYELVGGYGRSLGHLMRRSEAAIYAEPRRLETDGLVSHADVQRGRRVVPIYAITDAGRDVLRSWLQSPTAFPQMDAEPAMRVVFADPHEAETLRATILAFREETLARMIGLRAIAAEYQSGAGPYPHRAPLVAMSGRFVADLFTTYLHWCEWALAWLDGPNPLEGEAAHARAAQVFAQVNDALGRLVGERAPTLTPSRSP